MSAYCPKTQALLREQFHCYVFEHPPYSPDLAPSDFFLFPKIKEHLADKRFASDEDLKDVGLNNQAGTWYEEGINKLVPSTIALISKATMWNSRQRYVPKLV